jgi:sugar lactone lactonase YvrE
LKARLLFLAILLVALLACCGSPPEIMLAENPPAAARAPAWEQISFDDLRPPELSMQQSWNALGIDDQGRIYIGFTSYGRDGTEDFPVFRYNPKTGERNLLGTFLNVVAAAGNARPGEKIPKGHTKMIFADGKMYMASQNFHDLKWEIDSLPTFRGSHLFAYDTLANSWQDLSAPLPGGVVTEHEGIVSLNILPQEHLLVGLVHPSSDIVLYDYQAQKLVKVVPGIPWKLGNPLSREIIVTPTGHIYTYRGTEAPEQRFEKHSPWVYDIHTGEMNDTGFLMTNGFWIGKTEKRDGSKIFVSTTGGELYEFDVAAETFKDLGYMLPQDQVKAGRTIQYTYAITLSPDETRIYIALSVLENPAGTGELYSHDLASGKVSFIEKLPDGIYTSADVRDNEHIYFSHFGGTANTWSGNPGLFILHLPSQP